MLTVLGSRSCGAAEVFETNRFEQLLINYANDKLQNYFKQTTVGKVKDLYEREEIGLKHLPSAEPPPSLVLLEGPPPALTARDKVDRLRQHFRRNAARATNAIWTHDIRTAPVLRETDVRHASQRAHHALHGCAQAPHLDGDRRRTGG